MSVARLVSSAAGLVACIQPALAAVPDYCHPAADGSIDTSRRIDKNELATAVLDSAGVTLGLADRVGALPPTRQLMARGLSPRAAIVALGPSVCLPTGATADPDHLKCSDADTAALTKAQTEFNAALPGLSIDNAPPSGPVFADYFFLNPTLVARCIAPAGTQVVAQPPKPPTPDGKLDYWAVSNIRVRGGPADIIYKNGSSGFTDADGAKLSLGGDSGKSSKALVGTLGYALPLVDRRAADKTGTELGMVPFFAVDLEESRKKGQARDVSSDTISFGAAFQFTRTYGYMRGDTGAWGDWYIGVTPKVVFNYQDKSRIAGLNLLYRPSATIVLAPGAIELPINQNADFGRTEILWHFILDGRLNSGTFLRRGTRALDESRDFSRLGVRGGIGFSSYNKFVLPFEASLTDTYMFLTFAGKPRHLSQLKGDLKLYVTDDKIFGVEISYARGRIEDLDGRDDKWSIALSAKY